MENDKHKCWNCRWYKPSYTKGFWKFDKQNFGICQRNKSPVEKHEFCEKWQFNTNTNKYYNLHLRREACLKALLTTIQSLSEITQIIKESYPPINDDEN